MARRSNNARRLFALWPQHYPAGEGLALVFQAQEDDIRDNQYTLVRVAYRRWVAKRPSYPEEERTKGSRPPPPLLP
jgi:hypothetical protein